MTKLEIVGPPLRCPTGVCGPAADPAIVKFAEAFAVSLEASLRRPRSFVVRFAVSRDTDQSAPAERA